MKDNVVELSCHLIVAASGEFYSVGQNRIRHHGRTAVRVSINKPALRANEVAIALKLELPIALFQRPDLTASIVIPPERTPFVITPDVKENIAEQIREHTGFTVRIETTAAKED